MSGSISQFGFNTKCRLCILGCGITNLDVFKTITSYNMISRSSTLGPNRIPSPVRPADRSIDLTVSNNENGSNVVLIFTT